MKQTIEQFMFLSHVLQFKGVDVDAHSVGITEKDVEKITERIEKYISTTDTNKVVEEVVELAKIIARQVDTNFDQPV